MSELKDPPKCLLFASVLYRKDLFSAEVITNRWKEKFGDFFTFHHAFFPMKKYYAKEMGLEILMERFFILSTKKTSRDMLVESKIWADHLEKEYLKEGARTLNLDTGIVTLENLQLATGKNFTHRIYLHSGVFSDLTLIFQKNSFSALPWTYPDYQHPEVIDFFNFYRNFLHHLI